MPFNLPYTTSRNAIPYGEVGELKEIYRDGAIEHTRVCLCEWNDRQAFIEDMLPDVELGAETTQYMPLGLFTRTVGSEYWTRRRLIRKLPEQHPRRSFLFASSTELIGVEGYPGRDSVDPSDALIPEATRESRRGGAPDFIAPRQQGSGDKGLARIAVTYRSLPYNATITDAVANASNGSELMRYVTREIKPAGKNLPLVADVMREMKTNGRIIPQSGTWFTFTEAHLVYKWWMVPALPLAAWRFMHHINADVFDYFRGHNAEFILRDQGVPGKLLFLNADVDKKYFTVTGKQVRDFNLHFLFRPQGHNWFFFPSEHRFVRARINLVPGAAVDEVAAFLADIDNQTANFHAPNGDVVVGDNASYPKWQPYKYVQLENLFRFENSAVSALPPGAVTVESTFH